MGERISERQRLNERAIKSVTNKKTMNERTNKLYIIISASTLTKLSDEQSEKIKSNQQTIGFQTISQTTRNMYVFVYNNFAFLCGHTSNIIIIKICALRILVT